MEFKSLDPSVQRIISGQVRALDIPDIPQRVVRVFLSSTGTDSLTERDAFVERVYPRLREYCRERYGVDFQAIDLDWGLPPNQGGIDPSLADFRLRELLRCHELSAGPSFVAFIGQRYGEPTLPSTILATEYDLLRVALKGHRGRETRAAPMLDKWYLRNDNTVPPVYVLQSAKNIFPAICSADEQEREEATEKCQQTQKEVLRLLQKGAELCYLEGLIDGDTKQKYNMSVQESEVQQGTEGSGAPQSRCILLMRTIVDLKNYIDDAKAPNFAEIVYNEKQERLEMDTNAISHLQQLQTRANGLIAKENTKHYDVLWRYDDVIHPKLHAKYLNQLCSDFYEVLKRQIDETVPKTKFDIEPEIYEEVLQHWTRCKRKGTVFCGQDDLLGKMRSYLKGSISTPLVVHGPPGSGKATLLSKMALEVRDLLPGNTLCLVRYVGYTPKSCDIKQIILGLCVQLLHSLGRDVSQIPYEFTDLQRYFHDLLQSLPQGTRVVLFLDAVDKLLPEYNAHFLSWLPSQLANNVKIVVSTHSEKHNLLEKLKNKVVQDKSAIMGMPPMSINDALTLLDYTIGACGQVSSVQKEHFRQAFETCSLPMYVHLLADHARTLASYSSIDPSEVPDSIQGAIHKYFDQLENVHGQKFVSRALGYLVASITGLSDCELEDILSLDDEVLNDLYKTYHPHVRRVPYIYWLRLKSDIEQFLYFRDADGVTVHFWCHDEFEEVIKERYLANDNIKKDLHSMLADYFLGTWAGKEKPIPISKPEDGDEIQLLPSGSEANRYVVAQPLSFRSGDGPERFNKRKYDQVPRHLYRAGRLEELNSLVLFNYEWLYNKLKALSLVQIIADFSLNPGEEASLVEEALRVAEPTIENDINNLAPEITGHLLPYYKTHRNIRSLVQQCDSNGLKHCAFIPNFPYQQVPGSSLQYTLTSPAMSEFFHFTNDDRYLLTKERDSSYIHTFDLATGEKKDDVFASNGDLYVTPNGKLFVIVDHVTEKTIKVHNADTGAFVGQLIVMNHIQLKPKEKYRMGAVSLTNDRLSAIVTTESSYLCIADLSTCEFLQIIALDGRCGLCEITPNGRYVFCNSNEFLLAYDMYSLDHVCTVSVGYRPCSLAFTKDGFRAFLANDKETKLLVMHVHRGSVEMTYKTVLDEDMPDDKVVCLRVSPKDDMVLVRGMNNILVYNRINEKVCAKFARPSDVPKEFKLPKSHYVELFYTNAEFSRDGKFVIGTIFRNIYLWQVSTGNLVTAIQAPVGIIQELLVSMKMPQIVTHIQRSKDIQVWNINEAVNQINMLDKLTGSVEEVQMSKDNSVAYIKCKDSDEIGVIGMDDGVMLDLLTHDSTVKDFAVTASGQYVVVSTEVKKRNAAVKIWDMNERKVVKELGNTTGFCIRPHKKETILFVAQERVGFKAPYYITTFDFVADAFRETTHPLALKYILNRPFLTGNDKYMVVLTAQDYIEEIAEYLTPTVCAFAMEDDMKVSYYTPESFKDAANIQRIVSLKRGVENSDSVLVIYASSLVPLDINQNQMNKSLLPVLGLLVLDISTGAILTVCEPFVFPEICLRNLVFCGDSFCLDEDYNFFSIASMQYEGKLPHPGVPPVLTALNGSVVVFYRGSRIYAMRIADGHIIGNCEVHSTICHVFLCTDQRTLVLGCKDGTIISYVLIDTENEDAEKVVQLVPSRVISGQEKEGRLSRTWDKVENGSCPDYSRPPSALSHGPKDKVLLKKIKPAPKVRPTSDTLVYLNTRSKTCAVM